MPNEPATHFRLFTRIAKTRSTSRRSGFVVGLLLASCMAGVGMAPNSPNKIDPRDQKWQIAIDPHKVIGYQACEKCHANEIQAWKRTPHHETFLTLHRKPEAQQIASKLGISNFKSDSNCIQCHYTMDQVDNRVEAVAGVSCESCHGAAQDWVAVHNDYGGPSVTRQQETPEHRGKRFATSIQLGMRNPVNVYLVAQSCYRCHTVPDEKLVNVGGHNAGSLDFEMVSWSQGTIRHNFVRTDGKANAEETPARLRTLFLAGMIADLEFSMRATSLATEKATFGVTSAQRTARALERLKSAQAKVNHATLAEIIQIAQSAPLKLNNREQLEQTANKIHELGVRFGATANGNELAAIDSFIPPKNKWK
ncbi:MAG: cytochrome c family protein [Pirellula sp.]